VSLRCCDRKALLLGTALVSTLLLGTVAAPTPAQAVFTCATFVGTGPAPINPLPQADSIICVNTEPRTNTAGNAIDLSTSGNNHDLYLNSSGKLIAGYRGINTLTTGDGSGITILNDGDITVSSFANHRGIFAQTSGSQNSPIVITNSGELSVTTVDAAALGIFAVSWGNNSPISITNSGDITATSKSATAYSTSTADGIRSEVYGSNSSITNSGDITATAQFTSTSKAYATAAGIRSGSYKPPTNSPISISIINRGAITSVAQATSTSDAHAYSYGILALANSNNPISITNSGAITSVAQATSTSGAPAPYAYSHGIYAFSIGNNSPISITNSGDITAQATTTPLNSYGLAYGINARAASGNIAITINNSAKINAKATYLAVGIQAVSAGRSMGSLYSNVPISITNSGDVRAEVTDAIGYAIGILASSYTLNSPITINNSGSVYALGGPRNAGIYAYSQYNNPTTITNTGEIGAQSHLAIDVKGLGTANIYNAGLITGYVNLTGQNDLFVNQAGGVFETKKTSLFGGGNDLFLNQAGGTVLAATNAKQAETSAFQGLETFNNKGLISLQDGGTGDVFTISNTPGGTDLNFNGSGGSTLAVDAFLGGPGSRSDIFTIEGDVSGTTTVAINNTNTGPGVFNPSGIPVVFVTGKTPKESNFQLAQPIDRGFFNYDLFFTPTGSGFWDLKSYPGAGAHLLPQLVTAAQDIWHQGSSTWFDRTADLRVLLNGGAAPAYDQGGKSLGVPQGPANFTPATWVRGSGSWLDRDDSAKTSAYGRTYKYDLDRELDTMDFQMGLDLGKRDFLSQGDILVFGMLGGFVHGDLDYDSILRQFDFDGGQVGAYAAYLKGGLFVDTLLNVHLLEMDANHTLGFPGKVDVTTVGLRTDTGYRFGSFNGGAFIEPLATLEVTWANIDGFNLGGNSVSFDDDANIRGRVGARAGTTMQAWEGTMMEPFVIGSLWGNFTDDNQATLVSTGRTFRYQDNLDDVWGEVSAGVNFFNVSQTTSVFAKVDVTFGEDVSGVGGKAGMRVSW